MSPNSPRHLPLVDHRTISATETSLSLKLVTEMDLLKLKTIARLHARGLPPDVGWQDLIQEALTRVLTGARKVPEGIGMVPFLAGVMRSLRTEHWRRALGGSGGRRAVHLDQDDEMHREVELFDPAPSAERSLSAHQELRAIERLFADDPVALLILAGLGAGLSPDQICASGKISKTDYDSGRKRMRRTLLREGLTCEPK
jgi:DNA-directed RNA polymerase specialized sigma24 family protein